jgi:hypothetical protein
MYACYTPDAGSKITALALMPGEPGSVGSFMIPVSRDGVIAYSFSRHRGRYGSGVKCIADWPGDHGR